MASFKSQSTHLDNRRSSRLPCRPPRFPRSRLDIEEATQASTRERRHKSRKKKAGLRLKQRPAKHLETASRPLSLPRELRDEIFRYATYKSPADIAHHGHPALLPKFLLTSKQVFSEALPIFYADNTHVFEVFCNLWRGKLCSRHNTCPHGRKRITPADLAYDRRLGLDDGLHERLMLPKPVMLQDVTFLLHGSLEIIPAREAARAARSQDRSISPPPGGPARPHSIEVRVRIRPRTRAIALTYKWNPREPMAGSSQADRVRDADRHEVLETIMFDPKKLVRAMNRSDFFAKGFTMDNLSLLAAMMVFNKDQQSRMDSTARTNLFLIMLGL